MKEREIYLVGTINEGNMEKVREKILNLLEEDGEKDIILLIDSGGGLADLAISFYDWIKLKRIPLTTVAIGEVASAAMLIFLSGNKRIATSHSWFIIHWGAPFARGIWRRLLRISTHPAEVDRRALFRSLEMEIFRKETKLSEEEIKNALAKGYLVLSAQRAKDTGIIHEIIQV